VTDYIECVYCFFVFFTSINAQNNNLEKEKPMNIEIELRYEVLDESQLESFKEPLKFLSTKRIVDVYYDTEDADLLKLGIYIRVRDNKSIDFKFNKACLQDITLDLQAYCEEHTFAYPLSEHDLERFNKLSSELGLKPVETANFNNFIAINALIDHRTVDKERSSYKAGNFVITIDYVKNLGAFLEIELMAANTENISEIKKSMEEILLPLSLKPLKTGYDSMLLRKYNFQQYLQGRFILDEDKKFLTTLDL